MVVVVDVLLVVGGLGWGGFGWLGVLGAGMARKGWLEVVWRRAGAVSGRVRGVLGGGGGIGALIDGGRYVPLPGSFSGTTAVCTTSERKDGGFDKSAEWSSATASARALDPLSGLIHLVHHPNSMGIRHSPPCLKLERLTSLHRLLKPPGRRSTNLRDAIPQKKRLVHKIDRLHDLSLRL